MDATDDLRLVFDEALSGIVREPDSIQWVGPDHVAIANEGDYEGGSRGFTVFARDGSVAYEDGTAFERAIVEIGHYPERRSDAKGVEPEGMEFATFGDRNMLFVLSERGSVVGVYDMDGDHADPEPAASVRHRAGGHQGDPVARTSGHRQRGRSGRGWRRAQPCDDLRTAGRAAGLSVDHLRRGRRA